MRTHVAPEMLYPYEIPRSVITPGGPPEPSSRSTSLWSDHSTALLAVGAVAAVSLSAYALYAHYKKPTSSSSSSPPSDASSAPSPAFSSSSRPVRLGTRTSQLAMWQAQHVASQLSAAHPAEAFPIVGLNTTGDLDQLKPLTDFGNKGVFTKELDLALLDARLDAAVHCVKDLPTTLPPGLTLACILPRGDLEDALVGRDGAGLKSLDDLREGAVVGTSAMRRRASLARYYPHLVCKDVRGNINTRMMKLDRGDYDAIILAAVGLKRLHFHHRISQTLDVRRFGYAVGQGALGILARERSAVRIAV